MTTFKVPPDPTSPSPFPSPLSLLNLVSSAGLDITKNITMLSELVSAIAGLELPWTSDSVASLYINGSENWTGEALDPIVRLDLNVYAMMLGCIGVDTEFFVSFCTPILHSSASSSFGYRYVAWNFLYDLL